MNLWRVNAANSMLDAVVASFIDAVWRERQFDAAFMALLRAQVFTDIHFTHGKRPVGKDFIAKLRGHEVEWHVRFQSKAGSFNCRMVRLLHQHKSYCAHSERLATAFLNAAWPQAASVTDRTLNCCLLDHPVADHSAEQCTVSDVPLTTWDRERLIEDDVRRQDPCKLVNRVEAPLLTIAPATSRSVMDVQYRTLLAAVVHRRSRAVALRAGVSCRRYRAAQVRPS